MANPHYDPQPLIDYKVPILSADIIEEHLRLIFGVTPDNILTSSGLWLTTLYLQAFNLYVT